MAEAARIALFGVPTHNGTIEGDTLRFGVEINTPDGEPTDPDTLTFKMMEPDGTVTTFVAGTDDELVNDDVGSSHVDRTLDQAGSHFLRWDAEGDLAGAREESFLVRPSEFP